MKNMILAVFIGLFGAIMVANDADARRFGGGKSFGRSAPAFKKPSAPAQQRQATQPNNTRNTAATSGSRRWLGPLAGLVAGGLIGAMLFGDLFEGFQIMDFLLIAALVFGAIWLFKRMASAGRAGAPQQRTAAASAGYSAPPAPDIGSGIGSGIGDAGVADQRPAWFNEQEFLAAAKQHFVRLQAAWDVGDMKDIRDYTTPQLFSELTLERQSYKGERQFTEVVELDAELLGVAVEHGKLVAAVRYTGLIRERQDGPAEPFNEIWRIERDDQADANWYIAGIEQSDGRLSG